MFLDEETKRHLFWSEVMGRFRPRTPMGRESGRRLAPFLPGQEREWEAALAEQERLRAAADGDPDWARRIEDSLSRVPDVSPAFSLLRGGSSPGVSDWFRVKGFLRQVIALRERLAEKGLESLFSGAAPDLFRALLGRLNPVPPCTPSFSIVSAFDERIAILRRRWTELERLLREEREETIRQIARDYGVRPNRWREWVTDRRSGAARRMAEDRRLRLVRETAFDRVFIPVLSPQGEAWAAERTEVERQLEAVEEEVLRRLADVFAPHVPALETAAEGLARFDLQWSRMAAAREWNGCRPRLSGGPIRVTGGFHPAVADHLQKRGRRFTPIDIRADRGATVLIGSNMGGKTVALQTLGMIVALAQHGFFVPAACCEMPLVSFVAGVMGDGQDATAGLSTFGAEVKRLVELLRRTDGGLLLIDEMGRGTNPAEGAALSAAVTAHLARSSHWTVHVTHYADVLGVAGIRRYRTAGWAEAREGGGAASATDWAEEDGITRMDFRLIPVSEGETVPQQALAIAGAMGLPQTIIEEARRRIADGFTGGRDEEPDRDRLAD